MEHRNIVKYHNNNIGIRVLFYNIEGIRRLLNFQSMDIEEMCKSHIIGLYETWSETDIKISFLSKYSFINSHARRHFNVGRSSGGLVLCYRNDLLKLKEKIFSNDFVIISRFEYKKTHIIIMLVYIPPKNEFDQIVNELYHHVKEIQDKYPNDIFIVGGDFNARVADMDQVCCNSITEWGSNRSDRLSLDKKHNTRGQKLMDVMNDNSMIILNGRAKNDSPANFTFCNSFGQSAIDLVFIKSNSLATCDSLKVMDMPYSSHFPVQLSLNLTYK